MSVDSCACSKRRIAYFYDPNVGNFYFGSHHPMKPYRLAMTHSLVLNYNLHKDMTVYCPRRATREQLEAFHTPEYLDFLYSLNRPRQSPTAAAAASGSSSSLGLSSSGSITSTLSGSSLGGSASSGSNISTSSNSSGGGGGGVDGSTGGGGGGGSGVPGSSWKGGRKNARFHVTDDCPAFPGITDYIEMFTGASIAAAQQLNRNACDVAINWSGGMHHARKEEASGFCYANDIVLGILELLKVHARVLYVDIDIHHGDGVQDAFYLTDRVMTVSFHKYGDGFYPETGDVVETGLSAGRYCSVNVPLKDGMDDASYHSLFRPVIDAVMASYRPTAVVLQCGADGLKLDRLGCFNLTHAGHGECVRFVTSFGLPTLVVGGGGYTVRNVARAWSYETAILCGRGAELAHAQIPESIDSHDSFGPDYALHPTVPPQYENQNTPASLHAVLAKVLTNVRQLQGAPCVRTRWFPEPAVLFADDELPSGTGFLGSGLSLDEREMADPSSLEPVPLSTPVADLEAFDGDKDQDAM